MTVTVLFVLLFLILVYWLLTQILPERRKWSLLRPGLADGLLEHINGRRHERGLPLLEPDEDLFLVAEGKAVHQVMTGITEQGWEYPAEYVDMFGQSLLMEALFTGPMDSMVDRLARQRDIFDGEWVRCGLGVAGQRSGEVVVVLILCREAWEPAPETVENRLFVRGSDGLQL